MYDDENKMFFIAGEVRTKFDIMPLSEVVMEYQLLPLFLGHYDLPKLHILDRSQNPDILKIQIKKLNDRVYLDQLAEKKMKVDYIIKGFSYKIFV